MATDPSNFKLDSTVPASSTIARSSTYTALAAGFYAIKMTTYSTQPIPGTLTYQSDTYPCPYDNTLYTDAWRMF